MEEPDERALVVPLIDKAVDSTDPQVDPRLLKAIKARVRNSDSELRRAAQTLMGLLKRNHSQVRYLALLIIDELFMRSKLFRTLIVENLDQLLRLSVGLGKHHPLPRPASIASLLHSKAIEFLEKWNDVFGVHYRQLRLGYNYLKNTCSIRFPEAQAHAARALQQTRERERVAMEIRMKKFETFKENFSSIRDDIQSTIDEIDECLGIVSNVDENMVPLDDEECGEFQDSELRRIRLSALREGERVQENTENKVVFDALREAFKILVTKHLPAVQEWISLLIRVEVEDTRFRDSALKDLIDLKNRIRSMKEKCEETCDDLLNPVSAEDEIWEDGGIRAYEKEPSEEPGSSKTGDETIYSTNDSRDADEQMNLVDGQPDSNPLRSKLLSEAPVLKWGSSLDIWGSNSDVLANQRGLDVEGHWGRVDQVATIPAEKIAELNVHASVYEELPVEIQPCRAPLRKGGLCERRDLRVCPFHGRIIPRDDEGKPIEESFETEHTATPEYSTSDDDGYLAEKLLNQAIKNIRKRDGEKERQNKLDKQALKREKLAKVRKFNEDVLRDAAIASTWRSSSIGEDTKTGSSSRSRSTSKKPSLASMLRKKSTAKSRIAGRLSKLGANS